MLNFDHVFDTYDLGSEYQEDAQFQTNYRGGAIALALWQHYFEAEIRKISQLSGTHDLTY